MNRELISKAIALLVSYREYTGDCRIANLCGEIVEALKAELANKALNKKADNARDLGLDYEPDVTFMSEGNKQEPVAWQFFENGKWHYGTYLHDHRKNTEADGYPVRDLYTSPFVFADNSPEAVDHGFDRTASHMVKEYVDKHMREVQQLGQELEQK
jgi:hypothetical protein